jgi:hypothetical protein
MNHTTASCELPILFSAPMVRAILDGRKTQTRRVVKPQPPPAAAVRAMAGVDYGLFTDHRSPNEFRECLGGAEASAVPRFRCPYGVSGDRLWVREAWGLHDTQPNDGPDNAHVYYRATDGDRHYLRYQLWRPSIHMPRWASRITLEVTEVRVERVQDISEDDAQAEGVDPGCLTCGENCVYSGGCGYCRPCYRDSFIGLWEQINAKRGFGWDVNPWVWAVTFKVV